MQGDVPRSWERLSGDQLRIFAEEVVRLYYKERELHEEIERRNADLVDTNQKLRQEMAEREKLEETLEAKAAELDAFAYSVAHDLRAPLVTLGGFAKQLRADIEKDRKGAVEEDVRMIERGAARMDALVKTALAYARAGRAIGPRAMAPFKEIVEEALADFTQQIDACGARVRLADTFPTVVVDRQSIYRVLTNLIGNSINHRDEDRPLEVEIGHRSSDGDFIFFVRDNGKGIERERQKRVFDIFYPESTDGTGLGLAIARKVVEAHGGRIWLESERGRGTTIYFSLPVADAPD